MYEHPRKILRLPSVKDKTGLSKSAIYLKIARNEFPKQITLGKHCRSVGWIEAEVIAWIDAQIHANRDQNLPAPQAYMVKGNNR